VRLEEVQDAAGRVARHEAGGIVAAGQLYGRLGYLGERGGDGGDGRPGRRLEAAVLQGQLRQRQAAGGCVDGGEGAADGLRR
jgi:hypothetical protein